MVYTHRTGALPHLVLDQVGDLERQHASEPIEHDHGGQKLDDDTAEDGFGPNWTSRRVGFGERFLCMHVHGGCVDVPVV